MAPYRPDAPTLLAVVADLIDEVLAELPDAKQHQMRVAAHLTRMVERELRLSPSASDQELASLQVLVEDPSDDLAQVTEQLSNQIRTGHGLDEDFLARTRQALIETTRNDLAITKPGYTQWTGT